MTITHSRPQVTLRIIGKRLVPITEEHGQCTAGQMEECGVCDQTTTTDQLYEAVGPGKRHLHVHRECAR